MKITRFVRILVLLGILTIPQTSQAFMKMVEAYDTPDDGGKSITLVWETIDSKMGIKKIHILRSDEKNGKFEEIEILAPTEVKYSDRGVEDNKPYFYRVVAKGPRGVFAFETEEGVIANAQWFDSQMRYLFIIALLLTAAVIYYTETAKRGKIHFIRKIAGLDAVEEAIGRATEMGRPILYIPGIQDMDNVQTLAGLNILGMVAGKVAEYDAPLLMPSTRSIVMTTAREIVKESYVAAGRPDAYNENNIYYTTDDQFGFVAAVNGVIVREKPATCFYLGAFFAESLILAEVGNSVGAIQIAGTAMPSQIPFFIAACDYTLIGEELFAASAYLSQNPQEIGSLKGQDLGKLVAMIVIIVGVICATIYSLTGSSFFESATNFLIKIFST